MQTMTYNPPTAQVTQQKDVTYGNVQPNTKAKKGKNMEPSGKKTEIIINPSKSDIQELKSFADFILTERGDFWHPDPEQDRKLGGPGANQRAREDRAASKEDPKKLRPGESYMDYAKRHGYKSPPKKEGLRDKLKRKLGLKNSFEPEGEVLESAVPGKPAERLGAVTAIPQKDRDDARERLLAKTKEIRNKKKIREELEIEEGLDMKTFKANRKKAKAAAQRDDARKRGHVGKEWYNSGRTYSPDEAKRSRANMDNDERRSRHSVAVDPDNEDHSNYSADKTKNPKKQRKQAAMGESMTFSDFMEARRMDREGVDRGDSGRAERADKAKASLVKAQKQKKIWQKHHDTETAAGRTPRSSRDTLTMPEREHKKNHPGSRQEPKQKGAKETPAETHRRRVNRQVDRVIKHGHTSKERKEADAMAKHTSRFD